MVFFCLLFCVYLGMSQMWNLLTGFSGLFSLGQPAFIGLSGYTVAVATHHFGLSVWVSLLLAGLLSLLFALFMSLFIFRVRGIYYGIITLIFPESMLLLFSNSEYLRYAQGMFIKPQHPMSITEIYYIALVIGAGAVALVCLILRSNLGLALMAMRDNEEVANTMGVETFRCKVYCFLLSGLVTGLAGGIYYIFLVFVQPHDAFSIGWSVKFIFICIIGGIGTIEGPIVGTLIYVFLSQYLAEYFSVSMIILGAIAIAVILVAPMGIVGTLQERLGFRILSPHRD
jgi:branched-chain amino acid transport system permease protein